MWSSTIIIGRLKNYLSWSSTILTIFHTDCIIDLSNRGFPRNRRAPMTITFIGHSSISSSEKIKNIVKHLIRKNAFSHNKIICYLGGRGDFDELCATACRELKKERGDIELIYVTPYISLSEQSKIRYNEEQGLYDSSIYPPIESTPPRFAISKRNEWMILNSDLVIAYVIRSYGGAYKSLQVAKKRNKRIINICSLI